MSDEVPRRRSIRPDPHEVAARSLRRLIVSVVLIAAAWNLLGNLLLPREWYVPANLAMTAVFVSLASRAGVGWGEIGMSAGTIPRGLAIGLASAAVVLVGFVVVLVIPAASEVLAAEAVRPASPFDRWFVPLVRIPLGTAVFEEVLFRGVLLAALLRRLQIRAAVVGSSALFGLWHIVPAWETAEGSPFAVLGTVLGTVVVTTCGGLVFAMLRLWSRSLVAPILAHSATNSLAYTAALAADDLGGLSTALRGA